MTDRYQFSRRAVSKLRDSAKAHERQRRDEPRRGRRNYDAQHVAEIVPGTRAPKHAGARRELKARLLTTLLPPANENDFRFAEFKVLYLSDEEPGRLDQPGDDAEKYQVYGGTNATKGWYPAGLDCEIYRQGNQWWIAAGQGYHAMDGELSGDLIADGEPVEVVAHGLPEHIEINPEVRPIGVPEGKKFISGSKLAIVWNDAKGYWLINWIEGCPVDA